MKIFVLEDDEAIGIGLSYTLESENYEVTLVKTVAEAKRRLRKRNSTSIFSTLPCPTATDTRCARS